MAENNNKNIRKEVDAIDKQVRQLGLLKEKKKCKCLHTKNGDLDIIRAHNSQPGENKYICNQCGKELYLKKVQDDEKTTSCDTVDRIVDTIKLSLDVQREGDQEILKRVSKIQFSVRNELIPLYNASLKKNGNGGGRGRRNNNRGGNDNSAWSQPSVNGR